AEQGVVERAPLAPRHRAPRLVAVAEDDRLGRAGLLAGGHHLALTQRPVLAPGSDLGAADTLAAAWALLHRAAGPHRDFGVPAHREPSVGAGIVEEVEASHLVGAVVRAEARADAAVVDHQVEAVGIVDCRLDRADHLARRLLAMHAW